MTSYNPFDVKFDFGGIKTSNPLSLEKRSCLANIISSSLSQKIRYTYEVFHGQFHSQNFHASSSEPPDDKDSFKAFTPDVCGIVDYLGLGVIRYLFSKLRAFQKYLFTEHFALYCISLIPLAIPLAILGVLFAVLCNPISRSLIASILTLVVSIPLIFVIQPITYLVKQCIFMQIVKSFEKDDVKSVDEEAFSYFPNDKNLYFNDYCILTPTVISKGSKKLGLFKKTGEEYKFHKDRNFSDAEVDMLKLVF